ncbi:MAG: AMP-binding protein [Alphaproteobacteria bacterium]|nr:AMP-binding protein [Alphaproteobacteria bacterium]
MNVAESEGRDFETKSNGEHSTDTALERLTGEEILSVVRGLVLDLHPRRGRSIRVDLQCTLEGDLGIDSLGRAELLQRLEREFRVHLAEDLLSRADTPGDLLAAVRQAHLGETVTSRLPIEPPIPREAEAEPAAAATLIDVLDWHVAAHPDRPHIRLSETSERARTITYAELSVNARQVAAGLLHLGLEPGDRVAIMLPTGEDFFLAFFGALYAGAVPVPLYPPARVSRIEEHLRCQVGILANAGASVLVTMQAGLRLAALLKSQTDALKHVETVKRLHSEETPGVPPIGHKDLAMLQYTSGSTGDPKGVMLSHENILANIRAMGAAMNVDGSDVFVSWLPLYHDMGLIGAWLGSLYFGVPVAIMSPMQFILRPESWLWSIHRNRGTISAAPNFAFELCLQKIDDSQIEGLDLSSLRVVIDGAESVSASTVRRFTTRFADYGLRAEAIAPSYGLAENTVGLTCSPPGRGVAVDRVRRDTFTKRGHADPALPTDEQAIEFVACGQPIPNHQVRIVDASGREAPERMEGRLQFCGPSATRGYFDNPAQTATLFDGEWLNSGDLAYIAKGDVYITGRSKDVIIRAGRNIYPQEIEEAIGDIPGIRKNCVAVFGTIDRASGTERIVIVAESEQADSEAQEGLRRKISDVATDLLETPPDDIFLGAADTVPKTASGKIRRTSARELYEAGRLGAEDQPLWLQLMHLGLAGYWARLRRAVRVLGASLYAVYWWIVLISVGGVCWLIVVLLPVRRWRWSVIHRCARFVLRLTAMPVEVRGQENIVEDSCVLVANHSSYLDGLVLAAALPGNIVIVAKKELAPQFVAGTFLRRIDTLFVDRRDPEAGVAETEAAGRRAGGRQRLVFFPEGTFTRVPGLLPFHLGAFAVATQAAVPVVPVAIRGTRSVLRNGQWLPRRGKISMEIGEALLPEKADFTAAVKLRDHARAFILEHCGEPDRG